MAREFEQGDKVEWITPQGNTRGTVKKKLNSSTEVGGRKVNALQDDPRYVVENQVSLLQNQPGSASRPR